MKANLAEQILAYRTMLSEGTPLTAKSLLHLENRAATDELPRLTAHMQPETIEHCEADVRE